MKAATARPSASPDVTERRLLVSTLGRLLLLYFAPLLLLAVFFNLQYRRLAETSRATHLAAVAEHLASTLNLFLHERRVNLINVIDDPLFPAAPDSAFLQERLLGLKLTSAAFVDLGVFDASGEQRAYVGPYPDLRTRSYAREAWFVTLERGAERHVITDIYLGFRDLPHFTIAVKSMPGEEHRVLRAALSPEGIFEHVAHSEGGSDVHIGLVNADGRYQVVSPSLGRPLGSSPFKPPRQPAGGVVPASEAHPTYAYTWLSAAPWALVAVPALPATGQGPFAGEQGVLLALTLGFFVIEGGVIWVRARQVARQRRMAQRTEAELAGQLVHASKLAAVGELAAGIAHEINNPLAIIAEETGLMQDVIDPAFGRSVSPSELRGHLETVQRAVFRCRDITRKLLGFVRQTELRVEEIDVNAVAEAVVDGLLGPRLAVTKVEVVKDLSPDLAPVLADRGQLEQVLLNLVNNAVDAMQERGTLSLRTHSRGAGVVVAVGDTGPGIDPADVEKVFTPFYTTKDPGKGTGLGLSISFSIVKGLGGRLYVDSAPGRGATFSVELPAAPAPRETPQRGRTT